MPKIYPIYNMWIVLKRLSWYVYSIDAFLMSFMWSALSMLTSHKNAYSENTSSDS